MTRLYLAGVRLLTATLCLGLFSSSPAFAQRSDRATISGVVTDEQGAPVPGATVTVANEATGVASVLVTNAAGAYIESAPRPGALHGERRPPGIQDAR